ncbi:unnamed protein product [Malus baccata var. baccata]
MRSKRQDKGIGTSQSLSKYKSVSSKKQTIGVADGVNGWAKTPFIAAHVYNKNNNNVSNELKRKRKGPFDKQLIGAVDPRNVLEEAHAKNKEKIGLQGTSTACILSFNKESGVLHAVNVGDSGLMLFRDNKLLYQSPIQQRMFNFTYHEIEEVLVANSTSNSKDRESDRSGGDGDGDFDCYALASSITNLAFHSSLDKYNPSPFLENAKKAGFEYVGGKIDDITVIVAHVVAR